MSNDSKLNILIAYPYFSKEIIRILTEKKRENDFRLIVDSGAFTAWNTGKTIMLDDYCKFLDTIGKLAPFKAVQLDVFGDPEGSWKNFEIMNKRGYETMPVFTRGESLERLDQMYSHTEYIMFGGIVIGGENKNYVKWFLERNKGRKAHWLGFVNMPFIKHYKPESVDSSSWRSAARFGVLHVYKGAGEVGTIKKEEFINRVSPQNEKYLRGVGLSGKEMSLLKDSICWVDSGNIKGDLSEPKKTAAQFISTLAHIKRAHEVEKNLKTKVYLAVASAQHLQLIFDANDFLKKRGAI